jgi:hypothetical protein
VGDCWSPTGPGLTFQKVRAVYFLETFCTCSPSGLVQDPTVKIPKIEFFLFFLTKVEMADLSIFLRKMTFVL